MTNNVSSTADVLGIGIGPFNLSMAALLSPHKEFRSYFFDQRAALVWHPGMLLPGAEIQVSHMKDLVTLVDPTNPFSFVNYLAKHKRLYRFINSRFEHVQRKEFSMYLDWVSRSLDNLCFQESVEDICFAKSAFIMQTSKRLIKGKHLVLGSGLAAKIPDSAKPYVGKQVYHSNDFMFRAGNWSGKRVAVIGGGQSGAEIVNNLLSDSANLPEEISWVTSRDLFEPIDDSVFANELFMPGYSELFYNLAPEKKGPMLQKQKLASDGISPHLLEAIYRRLYVLEFLEKQGKIVNFLPNHKLTDMTVAGGVHKVVLTEANSSDRKVVPADVVVLCTGYDWAFPPYLKTLARRIPLENGRFCVNEDFSVVWDGPGQNRIYVQNAARHSHGVADPNLSLMAWRSAKIINSIAGRTIYDIDDDSSAIDWTNLVPVETAAWRSVSNA